MPRVICIICGEPGYTASPQQVRCECGGKLKILPDVSKKDKEKNKKNNLKQECLANR